MVINLLRQVLRDIPGEFEYKNYYQSEMIHCSKKNLFALSIIFFWGDKFGDRTKYFADLKINKNLNSLCTNIKFLKQVLSRVLFNCI